MYIGGILGQKAESIESTLDENAASLIGELSNNADSIGTKIDANANYILTTLNDQTTSIGKLVSDNTKSTGDQLEDVNETMKEWHDEHLDGTYDIAAQAISNHLANINGLDLPFPFAFGGRSGHLRDGGQLSPEDTEPTRNGANEEAATSVNMTKDEQMSPETDDLLLLLESVPGDRDFSRPQFELFTPGVDDHGDSDEHNHNHNSATGLGAVQEHRKDSEDVHNSVMKKMDEKVEMVEEEKEADKVIEKVEVEEVEVEEEEEEIGMRRLSPKMTLSMQRKEEDSKSREDAEEVTRRVSPRLGGGLGR